MHVTGREKFIGFFNSFHGRTLGSLSVTSSKAAQRKVSSARPSTLYTFPTRTSFAIRSTRLTVVMVAAGQALKLDRGRRLFKTTTP